MFAAFAILLITLHICSAERGVSTKTQTFPNKKLVLSELSFDNETLYYAMCDRPPKQCTVARANQDYFNPKNCTVDLKADDVQLIVKLDQDKAVLVALESSMLKTIIVHISSCKTVDQKLFDIPSNWKGHQLYRKYIDVVVFNDGFEVIVKGFSQLCSKANENKYCGFSVGKEGKHIEGPYIWPRGDYDSVNVVSPTLMDASEKGYFFVNENASLIGVQADRSGGPTHVKLWGPQNIRSDFSRGGQSVANNMNGVCYAYDSTIKCWQNDAQGGLIMSTNLTFKYEHEVSNLYVHNLPEGGFIILMITCPGRVCSGIKDHYYLIKIDAQGNKLSHLNIDLKKCKCNAENGVILGKIFLDVRGAYCWIRLCINNQQKDATMEISANCHSEYDLFD